MSPTNSSVYAVIMAGGSGTRFWPLSRVAKPKQLVQIVGKNTMIQATVARLQPLIPAERVLVITTAALAEETRRQLPMLKAEHVIAEPVGRDTAACVALAALVVEKMSPGATMILLPADQVIEPADKFQQALSAGVEVARLGNLVTFGIKPRFPATGYGYIKLGDALTALPGMGNVGINRVHSFVEKPAEERAKQYLASGNYRWNAGIFAWKTNVVLDELETHCGWLTEALKPVAQAWGTSHFDRVLNDVYQPLKKISIDYALMEKAENICVVTADYAWDDVGSWDALYSHLPRDKDGNIAKGNVLTRDCRDNLFFSHTKQVIAGIGINNMSVVVTDDAILLVPKGRSQDVKHIVEQLKADGRNALL
jgi:mannose-1-phosphate guanylyltransferase